MIKAKIWAAILLAAGVGAAPAWAQNAPGSASQHIYILDYQTGAVIYDKNGEERIPPASMSKLMTIYMLFSALKHGDVKLTDTMHVSKKAWATQGSKMFVEINSDIKIEDLLRGIVIQSGNDACVVVAEALAGSEETFADRMNQKAREIGLADSHFTNATGLPDPNHYMTARDLAILANRLIQEFPEYYHYFSEKEFTWHRIKQGNRNPLLYRNDGTDGLKTGHTEEAGFGLTASALRDGRRIIMVIHGLGNMQARADEAGTVLDWAFRESQNVKLVKAGAPLASVPVWLGAQAEVPVAATQDMVVTLLKNAPHGANATIVMDRPVTAPVAKGTVVGQLMIMLPNTPPRSVPVMAAQDVSEVGVLGHIRTNFHHYILGEQ
ncbi:MAG TPA: D-alanyl-D-alanine carboxypeptidase family protein [Dongiaceae bacterium]|jgi:D-alanyl-D-alanine carboxypeptidase (penicillin-binding protein 5/6)|nr:D-alanyl-D-alanine carboxypeptidase family protein [Dongiaceae bacterium]